MIPTKTTYEFSVQQIQELLAKELGIDVKNTKIRFQIGEIWDDYGRDRTHKCNGVVFEVCQ